MLSTKIVIGAALAAAIVGASSVPSSAAPPDKFRVSAPKSAVAGSLFGFSVDTDSGLEVVGAPGTTVGSATTAGAVYVRTQGVQGPSLATLSAGDGATDDQFGFSVAISGDTIVVGAPYADTTQGTDAGRVYVFRGSGSTWTQVAELESPVGQLAGSLFGSSVDVDGDWLVTQAPQSTNGAARTYMYRVNAAGGYDLRDDYLVASVPAGTGYRNNHVLSLSGATLAVGDPYADADGVADRGVVDVLVRSGSHWGLQAVLSDPSGADQANLGSSVALAGSRLVGGSPHDTRSGFFQTGSASVFDLNGTTWSLTSTLLPSAPEQQRVCGSVVAVHADTIVVGCPFDNTTGGVDAGTVYPFRYDGTTWSVGARLQASSPSASGMFGRSISTGDNAFAVGAPGEVSGSGRPSGAVYARPLT